MQPRDRISPRPFAHPVTVGCALIAYAAAALGCPLPVASGPSSSQPFPCQQHACGCRSAEACWKHCCCFSAEEKLAWARTQQVEPPPYAEQPADLGWRTVRQRDRDEQEQACGQACCQTKRDAKHSRRPGERSGSGLGVNCPRCHGHSTLW